MIAWSRSSADGRTRSAGLTRRESLEQETPPRTQALHERVAGAALRAGAFTLAPAATGLVLLATGAGSVWLLAALAIFAGALTLFLLERRDAHGLLVLGRVVVAGLAGSVLVPVAVVCAQHVGSPTGALAALDRLLPHADDLAGAAVVAAVLAPVWGLLVFVRARTTRVWPQALAGALTGLPLSLVLELARGSGPGALAATVLTCALGGLAVGLADRRLAPRVDPAAPLPLERGVGGAFGPWVAAALVAGLTLPALTERRCHCGEGESMAIGSLKTIVTAQTMYAECDKDHDGVPNFAARLADLGAPAHGSLIDAVLATGVKGRYAFAVVRDPTAPTARWCATADPVTITDGSVRRFWVNQAGVMYDADGTKAPALTPAPMTGPPPGWIQVGR